MTGSVHVVVPADIDDAHVPSGGNVYDRAVCDGLVTLGWTVHENPVAGNWPHPDAAARAALQRCLAALPDGALVLADGLVTCGVPEIVVPHLRRLRAAILMHLPWADASSGSAHTAERRVLHAAGAVIVTSQWAAHRVIAQHGLATETVHLAPPGVEPAPLAAGTGAGLLCLAAVTPHKGHDTLVEALASVVDLAWHCVCAGTVHRAPEHVSRVRQRIAHHRLEQRVPLVGARTGTAWAETLDAADLLVLPSHAESYGMVITEALAHGIPVLACAVQAVPDTLGHAPNGDVPGLLVPPGDPDALAQALRRWLTDPALRARLAAAARARRSTLASWESTCRALAAVLHQLAHVARPVGEP